MLLNYMKNLNQVKTLNKKIKLLILDVDGTLTDGKIYMSSSGELFKVFDIKDGYAIKNILPLYDIVPVILTNRSSDIVEKRCKELEIKYCYQNCTDKIKKLHEIAKQFEIKADINSIYQEIAYMGDDIPDLECMKHCGVKGCPFNAVSDVKKESDFTSSKIGGSGAVRDSIEWMTSELH